MYIYWEREKYRDWCTFINIYIYSRTRARACVCVCVCVCLFILLAACWSEPSGNEVTRSITERTENLRLPSFAIFHFNQLDVCFQLAILSFPLFARVFFLLSDLRKKISYHPDTCPHIDDCPTENFFLSHGSVLNLNPWQRTNYVLLPCWIF